MADRYIGPFSNKPSTNHLRLEPEVERQAVVFMITGDDPDILADGAMLPDHQTTGSSHTEIPSYAAARADLQPALDPATAPHDGAAGARRRQLLAGAEPLLPDAGVRGPAGRASNATRGNQLVERYGLCFGIIKNISSFKTPQFTK